MRTSKACTLAAEPAHSIRSGDGAASRCRPGPRWPAAPAIAPLRAERTAAFRSLPEWGSADDHDRRAALQSTRAGWPPNRMPSAPSRRSHAHRTGKLGACAILNSHQRPKSCYLPPRRLLKTVLKSAINPGYAPALARSRSMPRPSGSGGGQLNRLYLRRRLLLGFHLRAALATPAAAARQAVRTASDLSTPL